MTPSAAAGSYPISNLSSNPKLDARSVQRRLDLFIGGKYASKNLTPLLYGDIKSDSDHIQMEMWSAPGRSKPTFAEAKQKLDSGAGKSVECGVQFGPSWTNHWLKLHVKIPKSFAKADSVELLFDPSCEAMLFDSEGLALQGITGGFDYNRRIEYIIPRKEVEKGECVRYIEVSANGMFGMQPYDQAKKDVFYELKTMAVGTVNEEARQLMWDFVTLKELSEVLPEHSPLGNTARTAANDIMNAFNGTMESVETGRAIAGKVLGDIKKANPASGQEGTQWAVGYCHIDTAWLWPWSATQQKIARSWTSQFDLIDRYPEFVFMATSAQHFAWLEEFYPSTFERLQESIKTGRFELAGGSWVEMDGNMPSGESFCRQFLYGQQYFQSRFGKQCQVHVLPDTFGFSPQLPQLARLGGCKYFFNNRMGLNRVNTFPDTTFNWVGLDGTQLLTHVTPIHRYDSLANIEEITRAYANHQNLDVTTDSILAFGHGDGGGGPKPELLERLRRARSAAIKGGGQSAEMPLVKQGGTLLDFFKHVQKTTENGSTLPVFNGELYVEAQRGVLTSQANTKRNFRKSEILLREVELYSTMASISAGYAYPKERIDKTWQSLCLCMFHDTLPGTSIRLAVEDYDKAFAAILKTAKELRQSALRALQDSGAKSSTGTVLNTLPTMSRSEVVRLNNGQYQVAEVPAGQLSHTVSTQKNVDGVSVKSTSDGFVMKSPIVSLTVQDGRISSIFDHSQKRELLEPGATAGFNIFEDQTVGGGEAWETEQFELDTAQQLKLQSHHIASSGPVRGVVECDMKIGQSYASVQIIMDAVTPSVGAASKNLIRFDCKVDWHERQRLLKFELPLSIYSDYVTFDTAFGVMRRQTTRNNSFEAAKYEVAAHKFADYSEFGYGVALLNDCKYGYAAQGNKLSLSLMRAPTAPDEEADQGTHRFSFGIYPHDGTYAESDVQRVAHAFNNPLQVVDAPIAAKHQKYPFSVHGADNVILESIKRGESDFDNMSYVERRSQEKTIILRLHEHMGGHAHAALKIENVEISHASLVNVLEEHMEDLDVVTDTDKEVIDLDFRGFEVKTVKLTIK